MTDSQAGMARLLEAVLEAEAQGPGDLTARVRTAMNDVPEDQFTDLVMMLKSSRCLDVTAERTESGEPVVKSINGLTTRGMRVLQTAFDPPNAVHACPTEPEEGRLGVFGN